jgi:hypothetical protein
MGNVIDVEQSIRCADMTMGTSAPKAYDSTTDTSSSMTMYFAPVSFLMVSLAALWSQCAWLMRIGLGIQGACRADDRNKCPQEDDSQSEPVLLYVVQLQIVCYD